LRARILEIDQEEGTETTRSRPDFEAHQVATRAPFAEVARELHEILGARLTAYVGGVSETRAVRQWADGGRTPGELVQRRMRVALQAALALKEVDGRGVTQAWFQGLNPQLEDRSPARLLRDGELDEIGPAVLAAARAFLVGG
jgi:hypothetical protein